jgi:hypothetical protein
MNEGVRLKLARREFFSGGGFSGSFMPVSTKVRNIVFSKEVSIHYTPDNLTWKDSPLGFAGWFGEYDLFSGTVNEQVLQFVVRYTVGGQIFYDNNSGFNYRFDSNLATVGGNVVLNNAKARKGAQAGGGFTFTTSWLEGEILVNNLSFAKQVGVRLSADGGLSWEDTNGSFAGCKTNEGIFVGSGSEVWRFKTGESNFNNASAEFRFAIFYQNLATGETFWDNNFGQDYKVSKEDGSVVG